MSLAELEKHSRVSAVTLASIERGGDTKVSTLGKIAAALGVRIRYFFDDSTQPLQSQPEPLTESEHIIRLQDELLKVKDDLLNCKGQLLKSVSEINDAGNNGQPSIS